MVRAHSRVSASPRSRIASRSRITPVSARNGPQRRTRRQSYAVDQPSTERSDASWVCACRFSQGRAVSPLKSPPRWAEPPTEAQEEAQAVEEEAEQMEAADCIRIRTSADTTTLRPGPPLPAPTDGWVGASRSPTSPTRRRSFKTARTTSAQQALFSAGAGAYDLPPRHSTGVSVLPARVVSC